MKLRLGKMTAKELAQWFGISYGTFRNTRKQRLENLEWFADFEKVHGGVIIKKIYIEEYTKNFGEDDELYLNEIKQCKNGLSSVAGMVRKIEKEQLERYKEVKSSTLERRMRNAGYRTFGKIEKGQTQSEGGSCGWREYVWVIKENDFNEYRFMSSKEKEIYQRLLDKYFTIEDIETQALVISAYRKKEISSKEFADVMVACNNFFEVIKQFKNMTGLQIVRATRHEVERGIKNGKTFKIR